MSPAPPLISGPPLGCGGPLRRIGASQRPRDRSSGSIVGHGLPRQTMSSPPRLKYRWRPLPGPVSLSPPRRMTPIPSGSAHISFGLCGSRKSLRWFARGTPSNPAASVVGVRRLRPTHAGACFCAPRGSPVASATGRPSTLAALLRKGGRPGNRASWGPEDGRKRQEGSRMQ
jgi:hypothetical protein